MVLIHQCRPGRLLALHFGANVHVNFGARTAGTGIAHFPKIVLFISGQHPFGWQFLQPIGFGLAVLGQILRRISFKISSIELLFGDLVDLRQEFPSPIDGLPFKIIAKRPIAQHFEHGMVVSILAYLLQIVVFSTHAQALLGIGHTRVSRRFMPGEPILKGVHTGIGKHKGWVVL